MNYFIHVDDLGITENSSAQILRLWKDDVLNSFSIIANGDACDTVAKELQDDQNRVARIAVHFNLTEGNPSAPLNQVPLLINSDGKFRFGFGSLLLITSFYKFIGKNDLFDQIRTECTAQIDAVRKIIKNREISSIDSHNHIHMIPPIFSEISKAAKVNRIPEIRVSDEVLFCDKPLCDLISAYWWINLTKFLVLKFFSAINYSQFKAVEIDYCNIIGILYTGKMTLERANSGIKSLAKRKQQNVEVVFHVGRSLVAEGGRWDSALYRGFHSSSERDRERAEAIKFSDFLKTLK
jgi:predicted glycoside hydrolase/deacetylase ChbG (UPF0249 family)